MMTATHDTTTADRQTAPDYVAILTAYLLEHGDIKAVRVSSAQARGAAKAYSYWGAVRYVVTLTRDGVPSMQAQERASSDRRSTAGAERDADDLADREDRIRIYGIGRTSAREAEAILAQVIPLVDRIVNSLTR